jgi:prepilin peptidase CpaA
MVLFQPALLQFLESSTMNDMVYQLILMLALPLLLAYGCFSDLFEMRISNRLCATVFCLFGVFAFAATLPPITVAWHLLAGLSVLVVAFGLFAANLIGGGDAKFVAAIAVWFGFDGLYEYIGIASVLGGVLTLLIVIARRYPLPTFAHSWGWALKLHDRNAGVPYGIALGAAAMLVLPHAPFFQKMI